MISFDEIMDFHPANRDCYEWIRRDIDQLVVIVTPQQTDEAVDLAYGLGRTVLAIDDDRNPRAFRTMTAEDAVATVSHGTEARIALRSDDRAFARTAARVADMRSLLLLGDPAGMPKRFERALRHYKVGRQFAPNYGTFPSKRKERDATIRRIAHAYGVAGVEYPEGHDEAPQVILAQLLEDIGRR